MGPAWAPHGVNILWAPPETDDVRGASPVVAVVIAIAIAPEATDDDGCSVDGGASVVVPALSPALASASAPMLPSSQDPCIHRSTEVHAWFIRSPSNQIRVFRRSSNHIRVFRHRKHLFDLTSQPLICGEYA